jgi:hypothetical protein
MLLIALAEKLELASFGSNWTGTTHSYRPAGRYLVAIVLSATFPLPTSTLALQVPAARLMESEIWSDVDDTAFWQK